MVKAAALPDAELDVIAHLWQEGPATARQIREALAAVRPMTHGAVATLLKRLEVKKLIKRGENKQGKAFVYRASRPPDPTYRRLVRDLLDRVFAGNPTALVAAMFDSRKPTPDELNQLQQMLDDLRNETSGGEGKS